jgi:hypothetical protein
MDKHDCDVPGCKEHFVGDSGTIHWCGRELRKAKLAVEPDWLRVES